MIRSLLLGLTLFLLLPACRATQSAEVTASPELRSKPPQTYVILPFSSRLPERDERKHPKAAEVLSDAFETSFLETGLRVVERSQLQAAIAEAAFSNSGFTEADGVRLGKLVNANAIILGTVTAYHQGVPLSGKATSVSASVKAIDVESGVVIWKGSGSYLAPAMGTKYAIDPALVAPEVAKKIVDALIEKTQ